MEIFVFAVVKLDILFQKFPNPAGAVGRTGIWGAMGALGMDGFFGTAGTPGLAGKAETAADVVAPPDMVTGALVGVTDVVAFFTGTGTFFDVTLDDTDFFTTTGVLFTPPMGFAQKNTTITKINVALF